MTDESLFLTQVWRVVMTESQRMLMEAVFDEVMDGGDVPLWVWMRVTRITRAVLCEISN